MTDEHRRRLAAGAVPSDSDPFQPNRRVQRPKPGLETTLQVAASSRPVYNGFVPPVLRVENLCKNYRMGDEVVHALANVSLSVDRGEFVAIMGASGSGKSTLLHLMAGLDIPTSGTVEIDSQHLSRMSDHKRTLFRRERLGVVFQAFNLLPTLTAAENVALPLIVAGVSKREAAERISGLMEQVDLAHRARHRPGALSGGEQQRVAIARALVNDPAVILADEPTGNLDSSHAGAIWGLLRRLAGEQGRTIIAVTHEAAGAAHADRVVVLKDGEVVGGIETGGEEHAALVAARYQELAG